MKYFLLATTSLLLSGCVFTSPEREAVVPPPAWMSPSGITASSPENLQGWWKGFNDPTLNRTCDLVYNNYENKTGISFSTQRQITISQQNKLDVELKFKDYKFNEELSYPFSVPKKFKRI